MCGIYGQYAPRGSDLKLVERMGQRLIHRGPDGSGAHRDGPLAFGATRLAIVDPAAGNQPLFSEDRRIAAVMNGEIYNHGQLRQELESSGHRFRTGTDTEVLAHGFEAWGDGLLQRIEGMFALAVWDSKRGRLLLARDRMGEKPLYWAEVGDQFIFASEIKALHAHPDLRCDVNPEAVAEYLLLGFVPAPTTMLRGVRKFPPGDWMAVDARGVTRGTYWRPQIAPCPELSDFGEATLAVRAALERAVDSRMMADVPVGASLSGGLDSTAVVALMARSQDRSVPTFTAGYRAQPGSPEDEAFNGDARFGALAARALGTDHRPVTIVQGPQLAEVVPHLVLAMDEPISQPAIIPTAFIAARARASGIKVLLNGDAGDELFLGYPSHRQDALLSMGLAGPERAYRSVRRALGWVGASSPPSLIEPLRRYLLWEGLLRPGDVKDLMDQAALARARVALRARVSCHLEDAPGDPFTERLAWARLRTWVAEDSNMRVDKSCMAMSVEGRAPFQATALVQLARGLPFGHKLRAGEGKAVLKAATRDVVPEDIRLRPKRGFIPPTAHWLRTHLRPLVEAHLSPERVKEVGIFNPVAVESRVRRHLDARRTPSNHWPVWSLLVFHLWHAMVVERRVSTSPSFGSSDLLSLTVEGGRSD